MMKLKHITDNQTNVRYSTFKKNQYKLTNYYSLGKKYSFVPDFCRSN